MAYTNISRWGVRRFIRNYSSVNESLEGHGIIGTYAKSLYNVSTKSNKTDKVLNDFKQLKTLYQDSNEFQTFITKPSLSKEIKLDFLKTELEFDDISLSCLDLLFENKRIGNISTFVKILENIHLKQQGKVLCQVLHAQDLSENIKNKIKNALSKRLGNNLEPVVEFIKSPEIIGGLITKIDGKVLDSSVTGKLQSIQKAFN